ncbi:MAG: alpha/beta fold hydrolase [Anaerolineae bacterium]|nr:alpha/beta fold hydrolase [Anaerolineae bacterium]
MNLKTFDQLSLYYETHGAPAAAPIVLIHGLGADHQMWNPQIASLPDAGYFVIVPDLRGHGASDAPATFRITDCAHDLHDLLSALQIQRAHLIGVSMGGMVAQQFVAQYPESALSQILVDSLSGATRAIERFNGWLAALLLRVFSPKHLARMIGKAYYKLGHADVGRYFEARLLSMPPQQARAARLEVNRFTIIEALSTMTLPTLVLVGDAFGKLAINMAHTTAERIPDARFQVLPGGGDPSNLLVPAMFDKTVLEFLASLS